jgi:hypothetical protein
MGLASSEKEPEGEETKADHVMEAPGSDAVIRVMREQGNTARSDTHEPVLFSGW